MKKLDAARRIWLYFTVVFFLAGIFPWILKAQTATPELIVDICSTPHKYWNKYVMIKGHIRSVTANPPGTNRGSYVIRDSSDADITVLTTDLPSQGKEYTVYGNVEQPSPDSKVPVLREYKRALGSEAPQQPAARPRRAAPREEAEAEPEPVRRREAAPPPVQPTPVQPAPVAPKEVAPIIVQTAPPAESSMSTTVILGIVVLAALIIIAVVVVIMRPKRTPAPAPYAPPMPTATPSHIRPPAPPPPTSGRTVNAAPPRSSAATQVVPPPAPKATEVFFDLGMELVITDGPDKGKRVPLTKTAITLGRSGSRQNDVTLSDGTVSREHAKIIYAAAEKTFRLINESTTNPARLNGNPIDAVAIKDGDTIQIGSTIMKFSKRG